MLRDRLGEKSLKFGGENDGRRKLIKIADALGKRIMSLRGRHRLVTIA